MDKPTAAQAAPGDARRYRPTLIRPRIPDELPTPPGGAAAKWFEGEAGADDGTLFVAIVGDGTAARPWLLFVYHIPDAGRPSSRARYPNFDELLEAVGSIPELEGGLYTMPPFQGRAHRTTTEARGALLQAQQIGGLPGTDAGNRWALSLPGGAPGLVGAPQGAGVVDIAHGRR